MKTTASDINRLNGAIARAIAAFRPPADVTVSQWADRNRYLSTEAAEPGPWRTSRTPYLKEPMDCFTDPRVQRIVIVAASQVGKSEVELNCIAYIIDEDPGTILYVQPTIDDAKKFSKLRVASMIRSTPCLRSKVADVKSRDAGNTILQKSFPGGMLIMCGSNSPSSLASIPARYLFGDERDRWAETAGTEGDPWKLAKARLQTFYNSKAVEVSTPTVKNASAIEDSFNEGTQERWCFQCPDCGEWHDVRFADINFTYETREVRHKKHHTVTSVYWGCPDCGCALTESQVRQRSFKWIAADPAAYDKGCRSFWINAFVSPWTTWPEIVGEFLDSRDDPKKLQVVINTKLGELWEDRGELEDEDAFLERREDYGAELPRGVLCLTCGVDTQDNRLEYEVVGWGHRDASWGIRKGVIMGRPDADEVWQALDDVIDHIYRFEDGRGLIVSATFVDSGGHYTMEVYQRCRAREGRKVFAIKGMGGEGVPLISPPKKTSIVVDQKYIGSCWRYDLGVDAGKSIIMDDLKVQEAGKRGYCHFPLDGEDDVRGYGSEYFAGLLSERLVYKPGQQHPWKWEKIPGHERNEPLDCRDYALAAKKALNPDMDALEARLAAAVPGAVATQRPAAKPKPRPQKKRLEYESW